MREILGLSAIVLHQQVAQKGWWWWCLAGFQSHQADHKAISTVCRLSSNLSSQLSAQPCVWEPIKIGHANGLGAICQPSDSLSLQQKPSTEFFFAGVWYRFSMQCDSAKSYF